MKFKIRNHQNKMQLFVFSSKLIRARWLFNSIRRGLSEAWSNTLYSHYLKNYNQMNYLEFHYIMYRSRMIMHIISYVYTSVSTISKNLFTKIYPHFYLSINFTFTIFLQKNRKKRFPKKLSNKTDNLLPFF